jgi:DNA-binding transcriptional ArsR family regulator
MLSMKLYEYSESNWNIEFIYSPYFEMLCSLHVIYKPEHHLSRLNWYREIRERLDEELYEEIMYFGSNYYEWLPAMDFKNVLRSVNDFDVVGSLDLIAEMDNVDFIHTVLRGDLNKEEIAVYIKKASYKGDPNKISEVQARTFSNPEGFKRRFIACLKKYYYLYFERELRFIEPLLVRKLKKEAAACEDIGIKDYAPKIHSRIEVTHKAFLFHKYTLFTVPFASIKKIIIRISSFIDPHMLIDVDEEQSIELTIRVNLEKTAEEVPFDLFMTMKALGDETRLKILRAIYKKINSTQALAKELNMTEAGVSKHLKLMYEAGILRKKRDGNYINYMIEREIIDRIPMDIYQYLDS